MTDTQTLDLPATQAAPDFAAGSLFFVGTATLIVRYAGFTILTDPNFLHASDHVHLGYGLRATRRTNPAIELDDLPPIDLVILSHMHEDHFDRVVMERLDKNTRIITTPQAASLLSSKGFTQTHSLKTWDAVVVTKGRARLRISAMPGQHGPGPLTVALPSVMGTMLEFMTEAGAVPFRLYITGDTLLHENLKEIPHRFPDIDLALLHLGGTRIAGILLTMDAKQGVSAIRLIKPKLAIPIHYNDYSVFRSPLNDFKIAVTAAGLEKQVHYIGHGETYTFQVPQSRY